MCRCPDSSLRSVHHAVGEQSAIPQAVSPLRFETSPRVLAIHDKALVVVEQLDGGHVYVRDELRGRNSWISVLQVFAPRTVLGWI
jgi:hypothetical protein